MTGPFSFDLGEFTTGTEKQLGPAALGQHLSHGGPYLFARATPFLGPSHLWLTEARM